MAIKNIIAKGIGFTPGSVKFIPTHGFSIGAAPVAAVGARHPFIPTITTVPTFPRGIQYYMKEVRLWQVLVQELHLRMKLNLLHLQH